MYSLPFSSTSYIWKPRLQLKSQHSKQYRGVKHWQHLGKSAQNKETAEHKHAPPRGSADLWQSGAWVREVVVCRLLGVFPFFFFSRLLCNGQESTSWGAARGEPGQGEDAETSGEWTVEGDVLVPRRLYSDAGRHLSKGLLFTFSMPSFLFDPI